MEFTRCRVLVTHFVKYTFILPSSVSVAAPSLGGFLGMKEKRLSRYCVKITRGNFQTRAIIGSSWVIEKNFPVKLQVGVKSANQIESDGSIRSNNGSSLVFRVLDNKGLNNAL